MPRTPLHPLAPPLVSRAAPFREANAVVQQVPHGHRNPALAILDQYAATRLDRLRCPRDASMYSPRMLMPLVEEKRGATVSRPNAAHRCRLAWPPFDVGIPSFSEISIEVGRLEIYKK